MATEIIPAAYLDMSSKKPMAIKKKYPMGEEPGVRYEAHSELDSDGHISLGREERPHSPQRRKIFLEAKLHNF